MREQRIASAFVPPFALPEFVAELEQHGAPPLRRLLLGVEPIPEQLAGRLAAALPGTTVVNAYGPTEATVMCTAYHVDPAELAERRLPIGRALGNLRAYVLDPYGRLLPQGAVGELCVGGVQLARGYLGRPAATAERFTPDPYAATPGARMYRTGDLVRYRVDGQLEFVGRVDQQVKLHGQRVELGEIESVLARHPAVREAVAVVAGDGSRRHVVGYAIADRAGDPDELAREVLAAAARSLPRHMVPSRLRWLDHWPLSPNGKVDRARLSAAPAGPKPRRTAGTPLERLVAAAFAQQLGLADVDPDDNFFELGGHSLAAARVVTQLRGLLHLELPVSAVFQYPTVTELAAYLVAAGGSAPRPGIRRQPRGSASIAAMRSTVAGASNPEPPRQARPAVPEEAR
jgi:acyl-coenzyme A synthetase/AMP-(fatty) acid ligase/acyl carrier protein